MGPELQGRLPAIWMITAAFCFASMAALAHAIGPRCDWLVLALVRIVCTFVFSVELAWIRNARLVLWTPRTLWIRSVSGTISLVCTFYALTRLPAADVLTLTNTYPLWIVLLSLREYSRGELGIDLICVVSGVAGVALIQRPYITSKADLAVPIALFGSFATAIAMLGLHRLRSVDACAVVAHFSGLASLVLSAWVFVQPRVASAFTFDATTLLMLLGVGLTGTLGQVLITKAFASGPPSRISVLSLSQVVFALIFEVTLARRVLTPVTLLGFVLVLTPTACMTILTGRRAARPRSRY